MTTQPPGWLIESTSEFDRDYEALASLSGRLDQFRQSWTFYLERDPALWSIGVTDRDDDQCRVITYGDERVELEYVIGLSLDRVNRTVLLRWIESCPMTYPD